jgi:hypothetical protein
MAINSIEKLRAFFEKSGGLAANNEYMVVLTGPTGLGIKSEDLHILCQSATLPGRAIATADYETTGIPIKMPYTVLNDDVSISFLLTNDYMVKKFFEEWIDKIIDVPRSKVMYKEDYVCDIEIIQLDKQHKPVYTTTLINAFPIKISQVDFTDESHDVIRIAIDFAYDNYINKSTNNII